MTIVCGIDFSALSEAAASVAAQLAARHREPLVLVHADAPLPLPPPPDAPVIAAFYDDALSHAKKALEELAGRMATAGAELKTIVEFGDPDDIILKRAAEANARLIVVGSVGRRGAHSLLGSTADRLASRSPIPVMVIREGFPAKEWLDGRRPLRVVVASDLGPSAGPAVTWAAHLSEHGPCKFAVAHLSWPPEEYERLAIDAPMRLDRTHPLVEELLRRDVASAATTLRGVGETDVVIESTFGRTADSLSLIADRQKADLLVVGRGREEERHWWEASTSRAVVRRARMSVICVPDREDDTQLVVPNVRRILAATDLARRGSAAVRYALALARDDGAVHIVHVVEKAHQQEEQRRRGEIEQLVRSAGRGVTVTISIAVGDEPARVINAESERFDADLICLGSRGRSGLTKVLFGSVSQEVLLRSARPVLLVQSAGRST